MRRLIVTLLWAFPALAWGAQSLQGRWEGSIEIPGRTLRFVVDLAASNNGVWSGSIIIPGLGIKGTPLAHLDVTDSSIAFDLGNTLMSTTHGSAQFQAQRTQSDKLEGEMRQAGNVASFALAKTGPAQVEPAPRSTAVGHAVEGQWSGQYELGGYPRTVTLTLENHADDGATAKLVIVGRQTTDVPIDLVIEDGNFLRVESQATRVAFEGRYKQSGELEGVIELGGIELPLLLRRASGRKS